MCDMVRIGTDAFAFACLNPLSTNRVIALKRVKCQQLLRLQMWAISSFFWPWPVACYGLTPKPSPLEMCFACPNPSITRAVFVDMMRQEVLGGASWVLFRLRILDLGTRCCQVKDKPLGYHPNPFNDMVICVSSCPETATDGSFLLPDGPMGKDFERPAYPSANIYGQQLGEHVKWGQTSRRTHLPGSLSKKDTHLPTLRFKCYTAIWGYICINFRELSWNWCWLFLLLFFVQVFTDWTRPWRATFLLSVAYHPWLRTSVRLCLPLDLSLARLIISVKSVQTETGLLFGTCFYLQTILVCSFCTSMWWKRYGVFL